MNVIELRKITFERQGRNILSSVSWSIAGGEHWALLGSNGSGKTTLLKIITGYEWPTQGTVTVLGQTFGECNLRELRKTIGWVSTAIEQRLPEQDNALRIVASGLEASLGLFRDFTVEEFAQARRALSLLGIEHVAQQDFATLSQGEQQRVLIARALVSRPALLVLDEPCAGLDPVARAAFLADLEQLARHEHAPTMILVTHHIEEIGPWIGRVLVLRQGKVFAAGPTPEVLTSAVLDSAFNHAAAGNHQVRHACQVERREQNYRLHVEPASEL